MSEAATLAEGATEAASAASACWTTRSPEASGAVVATALEVAVLVDGGRLDGGRLLATR